MRVTPVLAALVGGAIFAAGFALAATWTVSLTAKGPEPATVTAEWGDTVVFSNADTVERAVASQRAPFESGPIPPGGSFQYRFDGRAGRYNYSQTGSRPTTFGVVELRATGSVSLAVRPPTAVYGANVTLSGRSGYPGTPVVVQLRQAGSSADWKDLLTVNASETGAYSGRVKAELGGRLRARVAAGQVSSELVDLAVRPKLTVTARPRVARSGTKVVVTGAVVPAGAASTAVLETYNAERKAWSRENSKRVSPSGKVTFSLKLAKGRTRLRVSVPRGALDPGFTPVTSRILVVVGK